MKSILINAYACAPHKGSELGMAWNWCRSLAKYHKLHIITEGEFQSDIEKELSIIPEGKNMIFYFNNVTSDIRKMCWNQGDWRFYKHYRTWQLKTLDIANEIIKTNHIDIIHQLNMIGFREPGYLWKIENIPFVWGPVGGLKQFPTAFLDGAGIKMNIFSRLKNIINVFQIKYDRRVDSAINKSSAIISSIPNSYYAIKKYKRKESYIIPETGCFIYENDSNDISRFDDEKLKIIWVGKFDFRKRIDIALKAYANADIENSILEIYGTGTANQIENAKKLATDLNIEKKVRWMGNKSNIDVNIAMSKAHIFLFSSVNEDTSTVVLEAISNNLPVICFDTCGMSAVINDKVGRKIKLSDPKTSVIDIAKDIKELNKNRSILKELSLNCNIHKKELSWENKAIRMNDIYDSIINN